MDILFLNHNVKWRSTFHRCLQFGKQLVARGHHVDLVTISPRERLRFSESAIGGVRVIESPDLLFGIMRTGWDPYDTARRITYLRRRRYDLVHAFDCRPAVIFPALAQARRPDTLWLTDWSDWWGRGGVIGDRPNKLIKYGFGGIETYFEEHYRTKAHGLTVISHALHARAIALGVSPERIARASSGAPCDQIRPLDKGAARAQLGLPQSASIVLFSGFVHYDLALLLAAFDTLSRERTDARLLLLGPASPLVARYAERTGWRERIIQAGVVEFGALPTYLACADVFALPLADSIANRGRWPNKFGDYLSAGRPIVSNPTGDTQEFYARYDIGYLTADTPEAFARGLTAALDDPARTRTQGEVARYVAEHELSWATLTDVLEKHYVRILARIQCETPVTTPPRRDG
jgi:glycosyltransferase involved in cell wall biosynthesis